jgi:methylenetetrahydrofolate dehydrogenase (NADP+) / methenyltetrahydrofolate cyclohydrolase
MPAEVLDGNALAAEILDSLKPRVEALRAKKKPARLVAIRANEDKGSEFYAKAQGKHCEENGIEYVLDNLSPESSQEDLLAAIGKHNSAPATSAILLHMPLPAGADGKALTNAIDPSKDAEGMHPLNLGQLLFDPDPVPGPCTALGAVKLALHAQPSMQGKDAVVVGHSQIVGRPAALLLLAQNASVSVAHVFTKDLARVTREAEVLIVATGAASFRWNAYRKALKAFKDGNGEKPDPCDLSHLIQADMVRPGATVIDVGVNRIPAGLDENGEPVKNPETGKNKMITTGDVDFENVKDVAGFITSPKGGTGPMTNAILLRNTVFAAERLSE